MIKTKIICLLSSVKAKNCGVSITLQLTHQGIPVPLPSNSIQNLTTSHQCKATDLVQDVSLSYLDWCGCVRGWEENFWQIFLGAGCLMVGSVATTSGPPFKWEFPETPTSLLQT